MFDKQLITNAESELHPNPDGTIKMTYEITPNHFGFTLWRKVLLVIGSLVGILIVTEVSQWIGNLLWPGSHQLMSPWHGTEADIISAIITYAVMLGAFVLCWHFEFNYSLEIDDNSARARWRVVRKGHLRYLREFQGGLFRAPRMELSEHGPIWVRFLGGVVVPKGLPEYEQIKTNILDWMVNTVHNSEE